MLAVRPPARVLVRRFAALAAGALAAAALAGCPATSPDQLPAGPDACRSVVLAHVDAALDGDTVDVTILEGDATGTTERIRLLGIDTPEVDHSGNPENSDWCGERAWDETEALVLDEDVYLTFDFDCEDVYQRTLAYVFRASDSLWVNEALIERGYARLSTFAFAFEEDFAALEEEAQSAGRGLWGDCE